LLLDHAGQYRREVRVLVSALEEKVAADLLRVSGSIPIPVLLAQLTRRLHDNVGMAEEFATWAVESWALALGVIAEIPSTTHAGSAIGTGPLRAAMPPATATRVDVAPPAPTLAVAKVGGAHYRTISEAIANAQPGTRILVRPGFYVEGLTIDKPLEIIGDGPLDEIIVEARASTCMLMKTDYAVVRNLTLQNRSGSTDLKVFGVDIPQGQLVLEDCDITSDSLSCVGVYNIGTRPVIRRCRIHDSKEDGVFVYKGAGGLIADCDIYGNTLAGVEIREESNPTLRRCRIYNGPSNGVYIHTNGKGTLEECDIYANVRACVIIQSGASPTLRRCKLHESREGSGLFVYENGAGLVEECDIYENALAGVEIREEGNPMLRKCNIYNGKTEGVYNHTKGKGTIEHCDIYANALSNVCIRTEGNPHLLHCKVHESIYAGLYVYDNGLGSIQESDIYNNTTNGVVIQEGSNPTIRKCNINRNGWRAVYVWKASLGTVEDCDLSGNPKGAWYIEEGSQVQSARNKE
jgi:F-box protein 11